MQRFTRLTAIAAPLPWADVNTDDIFPGPGASPVLRREGGREIMKDPARMGPNAFAVHRWTADGRPRPEFVLNQPPFDRAGILLARENFGCGSSREMAVWCLVALGIRCVVAPSFGDIFYQNCFKSGLLPVRLAADAVEELLHLAATSPDPRLTVDLETCTLSTMGGDGAAPAARYRFEVGDYHRTALLDGLDEIAATLARLPAIEAHEAAYLTERPWLATGGTHVGDAGSTGVRTATGGTGAAG